MISVAIECTGNRHATTVSRHSPTCPTCPTCPRRRCVTSSPRRSAKWRSCTACGTWRSPDPALVPPPGPLASVPSLPLRPRSSALNASCPASRRRCSAPRFRSIIRASTRSRCQRMAIASRCARCGVFSPPSVRRPAPPFSPIPVLLCAWLAGDPPEPRCSVPRHTDWLTTPCALPPDRRPFPPRRGDIPAGPRPASPILPSSPRLFSSNASSCPPNPVSPASPASPASSSLRSKSYLRR